MTIPHEPTLAVQLHLGITSLINLEINKNPGSSLTHSEQRPGTQQAARTTWQNDLWLNHYSNTPANISFLEHILHGGIILHLEFVHLLAPAQDNDLHFPSHKNHHSRVNSTPSVCSVVGLWSLDWTGPLIQPVQQAILYRQSELINSSETPSYRHSINMWSTPPQHPLGHRTGTCSKSRDDWMNSVIILL